MLAEEPETQLSGTMSGLWRSLDVFNNKHPFQSWRDDGRGLLRRGAALHRLHSPLGQSIDDVCRILGTWSPYPYHLHNHATYELCCIAFGQTPSEWMALMDGPQSAVGTDGEGDINPGRAPNLNPRTVGDVAGWE